MVSTKNRYAFDLFIKGHGYKRFIIDGESSYSYFVSTIKEAMKNGGLVCINNIIIRGEDISIFDVGGLEEF